VPPQLQDWNTEGLSTPLGTTEMTVFNNIYVYIPRFFRGTPKDVPGWETLD
jgi:hypothetical protein